MDEYREPWENPDPYTPGPQGTGSQTPGTQGTAPRGPEIPEDQGNVIMGIIGALLGALVGAVPWFLVSTFANFYVGWLGFLVGWAAAFGYRKLKGRRSFGLAMVAVVISSLLAIVAAELGTVVYLLCTDSDLQLIAELYGISVIRLAFEALRLLLPEVFADIMPNLAIGLVIGGLGILSAGSYVREYTDPGKAKQRNTSRNG